MDPSYCASILIKFRLKKKKRNPEKMIHPTRVRSELSGRMWNEAAVGVTGCWFPLRLCLFHNRNLSVEFWSHLLVVAGASCHVTVKPARLKLQPQVWIPPPPGRPNHHRHPFEDIFLHQGGLSSWNGGFKVSSGASGKPSSHTTCLTSLRQIGPRICKWFLPSAGVPAAEMQCLSPMRSVNMV